MPHQENSDPEMAEVTLSNIRMSRTIQQKTHKTKKKEIILWLTIGLSEILLA